MHDGPGEPLYGKQTQLALQNFPCNGRRVADLPEFVRAYALVKLACAHANLDLGVLDRRRGEAIRRAARQVADLEHLDQFPTALVHGGGGTATNMNVNEVIAAIATRLLEASAAAGGARGVVHPNDHVNASQSTNDTYPTAMSLAVMEIAEKTLTAMDRLHQALAEQSRRGRGVLRLGRTCLRDAVSLTVADTHHAQATIVSNGRTRLLHSIEKLRFVTLGGTVLGTGIGAPAGFGTIALRWLNDLTNRQLEAPADVYAAMAHLDVYAEVADACRQAATAMARVASDLRFLAAGPIGGPAEITLPALQAGSSIMPSKANPVIPELVLQLSFQIRGSAHAVEAAVAAGELELNVMEPVILDELTTSLIRLRDAATFFADKCVDGLEWNHASLERLVAGRLDELVDRATTDGYAEASRIAAARDT